MTPLSPVTSFGDPNFGVLFRSLTPNLQNPITNFIGLQNQINFSLNNVSTQFSISHLMIAGNQSGIVLTNPTNTVTIYLTYAEYLNWYVNSNSTLAVPVRTVTSNGLLADSATNCYSLKYNNTNLILQISALAQQTNSAIIRTDNQIVGTDTLPTISTTTA